MDRLDSFEAGQTAKTGPTGSKRDGITCISPMALNHLDSIVTYHKPLITLNIRSRHPGA